MNGDQASLVKDRAPEMGLETLFQSGRKGTVQVERLTQRTSRGGEALILEADRSAFQSHLFQLLVLLLRNRHLKPFSSFVKYLAELNEKKVTRNSHNKNS